MKKLVCLMMVALIGTVASATVIEGGIVDIEYSIAGNVATISLISDYKILNFTFGKLTDNGAGGAWSSTNMSFHGKFTNTAEAYVASDFGVGDAGTLVTGMGTAAPGQADAATGVLATFEYTMAVPEVTFSFLDYSDFGYGTTVEYYDGTGGTAVAPLMEGFTIPEPMTMALLGLGGLFIRRRK